MEVKVINKQGKATTKKVTLSAGVFGVEPNDHAIYLDVKQYLANQRQGTHQARERGEIIGSTRKIEVKLLEVLERLKNKKEQVLQELDQ